MEHSCLDVLYTLELVYKSSGQGDVYSGFFTEGEKHFLIVGGQSPCNAAYAINVVRADWGGIKLTCLVQSCNNFLKTKYMNL